MFFMGQISFWSSSFLDNTHAFFISLKFFVMVVRTKKDHTVTVKTLIFSLQMLKKG